MNQVGAEILSEGVGPRASLESDPCFWSARRVAAAIRQKEISAREYLHGLLQRIEQVNPALNSIIAVDESALEAADDADRAVARGAPLGPLHGVSMTVKDSFEVAGARTTAGSTLLKSYVAQRDAHSVASLKRAGAIIFGKSNLPEFAGDIQSYNGLFGVSRNPWDLERTCGGSSGGSAAAVAAGLSPLELGSDIAGSIRIPAHWSGVVGHKPSFAVVPREGHIPGMPGTLSQTDLAVVGPFARGVDDGELALKTLVAPSPWDAPAWSISLPAPPAGRPFRLAAWLDDPECPVDPKVRRVLESAAALLEADGHQVDYEARPDFTFGYAWRVFERLLGAAESGAYRDAEVEERAYLLESSRPSDTLGGNFTSQRYRAWLGDNERRLQMRRKWRDFFDKFDAILMPVTPNIAIPHDVLSPAGQRRVSIAGEERPYWDQIMWSGLTGVSWLPTTVLPVALVDGLPVGIAIVGPYLHDLNSLAVARRLETLRGPWPKPPLATVPLHDASF